MRKTRKAAAILTAAAMAAVSAVPVMADEIKDLYDYETSGKRSGDLEYSAFSAAQPILMY